MIDELDIFANAGRVTAHDEYIPFQIKNNRLLVKGRSSAFSGKLKVTFRKIDHRDNPKINALLIWRGSVDRTYRWIRSNDKWCQHMSFFLSLEIPKLSAIPQPEQPEEPLEIEEDEPPAKKTNSKRQLKTSGPKVVDPYSDDQSSSLIPVFVAIAAVIIPVFFCLCRL